MKFVITDASQYASGKKGLSPEYIDKLKDKYTLETIRAKTVFNTITLENICVILGYVVFSFLGTAFIIVHTLHEHKDMVILQKKKK